MAGLVRVVQASLLGSILSNLLLVLGLCFLAGGIKFSEQKFNVTSAQTSAAMLALSVLSLVIPAAFDGLVLQPAHKDSSAILALSRGTAIIMVRSIISMSVRLTDLLILVDALRPVFAVSAQDAHASLHCRQQQ
jgi:calcium/proton exchanger cax